MIEISNPASFVNVEREKKKDFLSYSTIPYLKHHCTFFCYCHPYQCLVDSNFVVLPTSVFDPPLDDRDDDDGGKSTLVHAQDPCHDGNSQHPPYDSPIPGFPSVTCSLGDSPHSTAAAVLARSPPTIEVTRSMG